jgi:hypothetical protein
MMVMMRFFLNIKIARCWLALRAERAHAESRERYVCAPVHHYT